MDMQEIERGFQEIWKLFAETDRQFKGLFLRNGVSEAVLDTFAFNAAEMADRVEIKELFEASIDAAVLMMNPQFYEKREILWVK